jgi:hypothetical protein
MAPEDGRVALHRFDTAEHALRLVSDHYAHVAETNPELSNNLSRPNPTTFRYGMNMNRCGPFAAATTRWENMPIPYENVVLAASRRQTSGESRVLYSWNTIRSWGTMNSRVAAAVERALDLCMSRFGSSPNSPDTH